MDVWYEVMAFAPVFGAFGLLGIVGGSIVYIARMFPSFRRWIDD